MMSSSTPPQQAAATAMVGGGGKEGRLARPTDWYLRNMMNRRAAYYFGFALPASALLAYSYLYLYGVPHQRKYIKFYKYVGVFSLRYYLGY